LVLNITYLKFFLHACTSKYYYRLPHLWNYEGNDSYEHDLLWGIA
jgi:hypothetical protein